MVFGDDTDSSLQAAAALVNSAEEPDTLTTLDELRAFHTHHGYSGPRPRSADLPAVRALRAPLRTLLTSDRDAAVQIVNRILATRVITPQVVRHDHLDYHVHAIPEDAPLADRIAVETAMAMIDVIRADEMSRLSVCADDTCAGIVVDLSRNRSRRFCSVACGNRVAVTAYRARRA